MEDDIAEEEYESELDEEEDLNSEDEDMDPDEEGFLKGYDEAESYSDSEESSKEE